MSLASHVSTLAHGDDQPAIPAPGPVSRTGKPRGRGSRYGVEGLRRECSAVEIAPEGERNNTLNNAALAAGQLIAAGELAEDFARAELVQAAAQAGLSGHEVAATIRSGMEAGKQQPREVSPRASSTEVASPAELEWLGIAEIFAPLEPVRWLVQALGLAAGAPALVAGYGFSGKTVAAQSLAVSIAAGLPAWGVFPARQGRVRHFDYEQGARLTRERYQRLAAGMGVPPSEIEGRLAVAAHPRFMFDSPGAEDAICRWLEGFDLAIVDSFRAACPTIDENSSEARLPLDMLTRVSERTGCVALVIHHSRKPTQGAPGGSKMAIRGSGALFDACASVFCFEGVKAGPTRISHEKARITGEPTDDFELLVQDVAVAANPRGALLVTAGVASPPMGGSSSARVDSAKSQILTYLAEHGSAAGKNALSKRIGGDRSNFFAAYAELEAAGLVVNVGSYKAPKLVLKGGENAIPSGV